MPPESRRARRSSRCRAGTPRWSAGRCRGSCRGRAAGRPRSRAPPRSGRDARSPGRLHGPADARWPWWSSRGSPHSLTSRPVRGALQVEAIEPTSTQALRLIRSIHFQLAARATITALSRTSASVSGYIGRSSMAKLVIWASGNARPMQSPSTTGTSSSAAGHERLDRVAAADLERHHRAELSAEILLHHGHGQRHRLGVGEALLADERRAHVGDDGDQVVVGQLGRVHQPAHDALPVELAHVQERQVRAAAAAGAQDPGADGEALDLVRGDGPHQNPVNSSRPMKRAMPRTRTSATPMAKAETAAAVGSKEYLR